MLCTEIAETSLLFSLKFMSALSGFLNFQQTICNKQKLFLCLFFLMFCHNKIKRQSSAMIDNCNLFLQAQLRAFCLLFLPIQTEHLIGLPQFPVSDLNSMYYFEGGWGGVGEVCVCL